MGCGTRDPIFKRDGSGNCSEQRRAALSSLHGEFGESGELQEILEQRKLPFVGSGSKASRLGIDKVDTKRVWEQAGLPTPAYEIVTREEKRPKRITAPASPA